MLKPDDFGTKLLLSYIADGDEDAFRQLFLKYAPFLQSRLNRLIKSTTEQEDIIQETFLRIWLHRNQLPDIEHWTAWLLKICYNRAFTHLYKQRCRQDMLAGLKPVESRNETWQDFELIVLKNAIAETVSRLPEQQRKIYLLNRENGLKIAEIAEKLHLSIQTVKNHLGLAIRSIRNTLEQDGYLFIILAFTFPKLFF